MEKRNILIGGAWPYANSSLHLGHIAGLISGDVLARYFRLKGDNVLYVSLVKIPYSFLPHPTNPRHKTNNKQTIFFMYYPL